MKLWKAMVRATAALLLMAAIVTPALAEIGCAEESVTHLSEALNAGEHAAEVTAAGQSGDQDNQGMAVGHCAFSHGHCAGLPSVSNATAPSPRVAAAYGLLRTSALAPASLDTPERPPNA
ncbi:hypothetical protein E2493_09830 [Sphingomonas parva]|uniref:DUF2946 domain-containing protein n=1 Tax=Sphingomonas parva TaxID=2555898 RepID=A0A4Y8ZTF8_9SPHN|nr:hypothetical protein [Sphingomonas parva]TFI58425.1 hypothetical protein E2493_09830 [Sphingomonas parva]